MTNVKLSQIAPSPSNVAATTQFVAVEGGNTDYLFSPSQFINGFNLLRSTIADQVLSGGWNVVPHTNTTGSITIDCGQGPLQTITNNGAFTINAPASDGQTILQVTNGAAAGVITFSGFSTGNVGDPIATTSGQIYAIMIWRINGISQYYTIATNSAPILAVYNVRDFGALGNNIANDTASIQAAITAATPVSGAATLSVVFFPHGTYKVSPPVAGGACITLPPSSASPSIVIEGCGAGSSVIASCNGFIFDDLNPTGALAGATHSPWVMRTMAVSNNYTAPAIYIQNIFASATWVRGASTISVTAASSTGNTAFNPAGGQVLFGVANHAFKGGNVPGYIGYVTSVTSAGANNTLAIGGTGAVGPTGLQVTGAQVTSGTPASNSPPGAFDTIFAVQGYFAGASWTGTHALAATTITTALSYPTQVNNGSGLDAGWYYVWDWSTVPTRGPIPKCVGLTSIGIAGQTATWSGTNLTLTMGAQFNSIGAADLLILTPISGGIRHVSTIDGLIESCAVGGINPISLEAAGFPGAISGTASNPYSWYTTVSNCYLNTVLTPSNAAGASSAVIGATGVSGGQGTYVLQTDASGFWTGIRLYGANVGVFSGRQEVTCYGIVLGGLTNGPPNAWNNVVNAFSIVNTEQEGCWGACIYTDGPTSFGVISGLINQESHANSCLGVALTGTAIVVSGCDSAGGAFWNPSFASPAAFAAYDAISSGGRANRGGITFISCIGSAGFTAYSLAQNQPSVAWGMPSFANTAKWLNCNNPAPIYPFANLPLPDPNLTGSISVDGLGTTTGTLLTISAGSIGQPAVIGSLVAGGSPVAIAANTIITSNTISASGVSNSQAFVNNSQAIAAGTTGITLYPILDGEEYYISDSRTPYQNSVWSAATTYVIGNVVLATDGILYTSRTNSNTNHNPTANGDPTNWTQGSYVGGVSNYGTAITVGGGTHHVKVRWSHELISWILV